MATEARRLAGELGLVGSHVFFNEGWVPYDKRQSYLLEADLGVSTHLDHLETAFSFRTRILDYIWASLPIVTTEGDALADLVTGEGLGSSVPPATPKRSRRHCSSCCPTRRRETHATIAWWHCGRRSSGQRR